MELWLVFIISGLAIGFALFLAQNVLKRSTGTPQMQNISDAIKEGAEAFLARQNKTIAGLAVALAALLFILYAFLRQPSEGDPKEISVYGLAVWTVISFSLGAASSVIAGYIGMWVAIRTNIRTATAAVTSLNGALQTALRGGAVAGFFVVTLSLLGIAVLFTLVRNVSGITDISKIPILIAGFGFGASFVALFAQLGGGIYTKAADVGADLVGKVEAGIPEDDPRNPAVIADLVGDNVGDCAGRGADLFESISAENIGALILAAALFASNTQLFGAENQISVIMFPLVVTAFGILASMVGVMVVRTSETTKNPMNALNFGFYVTALFAAIGFGIACYWLLNPAGAPTAWWKFFICGVIGIATSIAFLFITQYYTESNFRPVQSIANSSLTGPATNVISGIAVGLECVALPVIAISIAIISTYAIGETTGLANAGLFGTAVATMGMLGTAGYVLAMDNFGPITDNAGGIVEMSDQPDEVRNKTDRLDSVGNTTKALTKGYAVGSAALAAFLLFSAYITEVGHYGLRLDAINMAKPAVFVGGLIGAMLVFLFASLAIRAVGKAAQVVIEDVRDQFRNDPGILAGTSRPNYGRTVDIVTKSALQQMILPGVLAVGVPIAVGLIFRYLFYLQVPAGFRIENLKTLPLGSPILSLATGAEVVAGMLMVGTIAGILMALFLNNAGGAWDNAKKFIESGDFKDPDGMVHRKKSEAHKAAVVGDTVGDPFKDTAGPSLHVLIKLLATITLVLAPFFI
ncbi:MAG: sodium-translocating pyrophosphatase [Acidobacteria bacterium]|nr:sodium-translocating pyrophosphatase [Acidobacteriota bacterium]